MVQFAPLGSVQYQTNMYHDIHIYTLKYIHTSALNLAVGSKESGGRVIIYGSVLHLNTRQTNKNNHKSSIYVPTPVASMLSATLLIRVEQNQGTQLNCLVTLLSL